MTDDELKKARALCDAATAGPWQNHNDLTIYALDETGRPKSEICIKLSGSFSEKKADCDFIAGARTLLPLALNAIAPRADGMEMVSTTAMAKVKAALEKFDSAVWDRLYAGGPLSKEYAQATAAEIREALAALENR